MSDSDCSSVHNGRMSNVESDTEQRAGIESTGVNR